MVRAALICTLILVAGCARSEDASLVGDLNEQPPVNERAQSNEADSEEIAIGAWRETLQEDTAALEFGPEGTPPQFSLRCSASGGLLLQRHGATPMGDLPTMRITVGRVDRQLPVTASGGTVPMLRATAAADDPLIPALRSAATPIAVRVGDALPLVLPPGPPVADFLTRCSGGTAAPAAAAPAPAEANGAAPATNGAAAQ